jgi:hypothetical protein
MKREVFAVALAMTAGFPSSVSAQYSYALGDIAPDQRSYIRDQVLRERVRPMIGDPQIRLGGTVPTNVELRPVPADWALPLQRLFYFISDDRVHFVDPANRRVVLDIF